MNGKKATKKGKKDVPDSEVISDGTHALITSIEAIGAATAVLPVVSTLVFVFALTSLVSRVDHYDAKKTSVSEGVIMFLDAMSASMSLFTTTYSVLEFYYIKMITASDVFKEYSKDHIEIGDEMPVLAVQRDDLARLVDSMVMSFEPMRKQARNSLWSSVMVLLLSSVVQILSTIRMWLAVILSLTLIAGAVAVPVTVLAFRRNYRPILAEYRPQATLHLPTAHRLSKGKDAAV